MKLKLGIFILFLVLLLFLDCSFNKSKNNYGKFKLLSTEKKRENSIPKSKSLFNGQRQYHIRGCQKCHGIAGDGKGTKAYQYPPEQMPRDFQELKSYKQGYEFENIIFTLKNGIVNESDSLMPKYPFIVDEEVRHIAEYVIFLRTNQVMRKIAPK